MKAYVFPGQGAQFTGMGKDLYENSPFFETLTFVSNISSYVSSSYFLCSIEIFIKKIKNNSKNNLYLFIKVIIIVIILK